MWLGCHARELSVCKMRDSDGERALVGTSFRHVFIYSSVQCADDRHLYDTGIMHGKYFEVKTKAQRNSQYRRQIGQQFIMLFRYFTRYLRPRH